MSFCKINPDFFFSPHQHHRMHCIALTGMHQQQQQHMFDGDGDDDICLFMRVLADQRLTHSKQQFRSAKRTQRAFK